MPLATVAAIGLSIDIDHLGDVWRSIINPSEAEGVYCGRLFARLRNPLKLSGLEMLRCRAKADQKLRHFDRKQRRKIACFKGGVQIASLPRFLPGFLASLILRLSLPVESGEMRVQSEAATGAHSLSSKSEYVRCLCFAHENVLYVATNNGILYHVEICNPGAVRWIQLAQVSKESPVICMDLMSMRSCKTSFMEYAIAIGDGMGKATVMKLISGKSTSMVVFSLTWTAEKKTQLLGIYWCKSLGCRQVLVDPRGVLKLWKLNIALDSDTDDNNLKPKVSFVAEFTSYFGARIMCLDASTREQVLVCGDQRGNLTVYPLLEDIMNADSIEIVEKVSIINQFKGAHGISTVTSIMITMLGFNQLEIRTAFPKDAAYLNVAIANYVEMEIVCGCGHATGEWVKSGNSQTPLGTQQINVGDDEPSQFMDIGADGSMPTKWSDVQVMEDSTTTTKKSLPSSDKGGDIKRKSKTSAIDQDIHECICLMVDSVNEVANAIKSSTTSPQQIRNMYTELMFELTNIPGFSKEEREFQKSSLSSTCLRVEGKRGRAWEREEEICEGEFVRVFTKVAPSKGSVHLLRASSWIFEGLGGVHFSEKRRFSAGFGWKQKEVRFSASFRRKRKESKVLCLTGLVKRSVSII
ncbi:hypothetical protein M5K25_017761 [Dendrobium thyrsiflorum]|uniref:Uncharacterized protein n=1 Tax=Dendrobium thyrsiflorum TaxID=117978 RepID=A0ABD0UGE2_DENTH